MADASAQSYEFELVSPEERLISGKVSMAVVPGKDGEIGAGYGHTSLVVGLQPGVVRLFEEDGKEGQQIFISGGFADISAEGCSVLAEEALPVKDLDKDALEQQRKDLTEDLDMIDDEQDRMRIYTRLRVVEAKLQVLNNAFFS